MNIFYLHHDPFVCAQMHIDKHCVKMILEYTQLLSTAHRLLDGVEVEGKTKTGRSVKRWKLNEPLDDIVYAATHVNHPSAIWVRQSYGNYAWLANLLNELCKEYTFRYKKIHKVERTGLAHLLRMKAPTNIPQGKFIEPPPAMPDEYKADNAIQSYHNYYNGSKRSFARWTNRPTPLWFHA